MKLSDVDTNLKRGGTGALASISNKLLRQESEDFFDADGEGDMIGSAIPEDAGGRRSALTVSMPESPSAAVHKPETPVEMAYAMSLPTPPAGLDEGILSRPVSLLLHIANLNSGSKWR